MSQSQQLMDMFDKMESRLDKQDKIIQMLLDDNIDRSNLPVGTIGIADQDIQERGDSKEAIFNIRGTQERIEVEARTDIDRGEPIKVVEEGNKVSPIEQESGDVISTLVSDISSLSRIKEDSADDVGEDNAFVIDLGQVEKDVDIALNFSSNSNNANIVIQVSRDNENFTQFDSLQPGGSGSNDPNLEDVIQVSTTFRYVRVFAQSGFNSSELTTLEASAKGI